MTAFLIGALLLIGLAIAFLLWPLLRGGAGTGNREKEIVALYRDKYRELASDHAAGSVSAEQFESGRRELERRLLEDVAQPASTAAPARRPTWTAAAVAAFILVLPIGFYLALGKPEAIRPVPSEAEAAGSGQAGADAKAAPHEITAQQLQAMIDKLVKHLDQSPKDGDGWAMLARTYAYTRQFPEAVKAYARAAELLPTDSHLLADYADAMAMTNERRLAGEPMKLITRALALNPVDIKALALAGSDAFDRHDYRAAVGYWERAIKAGPQDAQFAQFAEQLRASIEEARKLGGMPAAATPPVSADAGPAAAPPAAAAPAVPAAGSAAGAYVKGQVTLAAALAGKVAPTDTVFIFARASEGPRMPLALMKRQVKDLPLEFALDQSMAMMPDLNLSKFSSVVVGARISKGGDAMARSGDLQGFSAPVKVGTTGIKVQIDQVVP